MRARYLVVIFGLVLSQTLMGGTASAGQVRPRTNSLGRAARTSHKVNLLAHLPARVWPNYAKYIAAPSSHPLLARVPSWVKPLYNDEAQRKAPAGPYITTVTIDGMADINHLRQLNAPILSAHTDTATVIVNKDQLERLALHSMFPADTQLVSQLEGGAKPLSARRLAVEARTTLTAAVIRRQATRTDTSCGTIPSDNPPGSTLPVSCLTTQERSWWCLTPGTDKSNNGTYTDDQQVQAIEDWLQHIRLTRLVTGPPFSGWSVLNTSGCPDQDQDGVPDNVELFQVGLNATATSTANDRYTDGQKLFQVGPPTAPQGFTGGKLPGWVKAPYDSPYVAALPAPQVTVDQSSLQVKPITTITSGTTTLQQTEHDYSTSTTQESSYSVANTKTWNNWTEVSQAITQPLGSSTSQARRATARRDLKLENELHELELRWQGAARDPKLRRQLAERIAAVRRDITGDQIWQGVQIAGDIGSAVCGTPLVGLVIGPVPVGGIACVAGTAASVAAQIHGGLTDSSGANSVQPQPKYNITNNNGLTSNQLSAVTGNLTSGFQGEDSAINGVSYAINQQGALLSQGLQDVAYAIDEPKETTTNTSGQSQGGAITTTQEQSQANTVSQGTALFTGRQWSQATAVNSDQAASLNFAFTVSNTGADVFNDLNNLTFNIYLGNDTSPIISYPAWKQFTNGSLGLQPGASATYNTDTGTTNIDLSLDELERVDEGTPVRVVLGNYGGSDQAVIQNAEGSGVTVQTDDGNTADGGPVHTYVIPSWTSESYQDVLSRFFNVQTDSQKRANSMQIPEYGNNGFSGWEAEPLTNLSWWTVYFSQTGDGGSPLDQTASVPGSSLLIRFDRDSDGDGYSDRLEEEYGTNPFDPASHPNPQILAGTVCNPSGDSLAVGTTVTCELEMQNTGTFPAFGISATMYAPDASTTITDALVGGNGVVNPGQTVSVGSLIEQPDLTNWGTGSDAALPFVSGGYSGSGNQTYTFTAPNSETVDQSGATLSWSCVITGTSTVCPDGGTGSIDIGSSYESPLPLSVSDGLQVGLQTGTITSGNSFSVQTFAPEDTFSFKVNSTSFTPPVVLVHYSDEQGAHRLITPVSVPSLGTPLSPTYSGQMLQNAGVHIVTTAQLSSSTSNATNVVVDSPSPSPIQNAKVEIDFVSTPANGFGSSLISNVSCSGGVATVTAPNSLTAGETVTLTNVSPAGYNGTYAVGPSPTSTQFTYTVPSCPGTGYVDGTGSVSDGAVVCHIEKQVNLQPGPTVIPVAFTTSHFSTSACLAAPASGQIYPTYYPTGDNIMSVSWTDSQGDIIDSTARPFSTFGVDPTPQFNTGATGWSIGSVTQGAQVQQNVSVVNTGLLPLHIALSSSDSNVTLMDSSGNPLGNPSPIETIPAGGTYTATASIDTANESTGALSSSLVIRSDDPSNATTTIPITGTVNAPANAAQAFDVPNQPWTKMVRVYGNVSQYSNVSFNEDIQPDDATVQPCLMYDPGSTNLRGAGQACSDFANGTGTSDLFGSGQDGPLNLTSNSDSHCASGGADGSDCDLNMNRAVVLSGTEGSKTIPLLEATGFAFKSGQLVLISQTQGTGAGEWETNYVSSVSGQTLTLRTALKNNYVSDSGDNRAQVLVVPQFTNLTIGSSVSVSPVPWGGSVGGIEAFDVAGTLTVDGALSANGAGFRGGAGTFSNAGTGYTGEGPEGQGENAGSGYPNGTVSPLSPGAGQGGGNLHLGSSGGGGGGHATPGGAAGISCCGLNGAPEGAGGTTYDRADFSSMTLGAGGGGAGQWENNPGNQPGGGGGDGGGLIIVNADTVTVSGSVSASGTSGQSVATYGGGGGAGGGIYMQSASGSFGNGLLTSIGYPGGSGGWSQAYGGTGGSGYITLGYCGVPPTALTAPTAYTQKLSCYLATESSGTVTYTVPDNITNGQDYEMQFGHDLSFSGSNSPLTTYARVPVGTKYSSATLDALLTNISGSVSGVSIDVGTTGTPQCSDSGSYSASTKATLVDSSDAPCNLATAFNNYVATYAAAHPSATYVDVPITVGLTGQGDVVLTNLVLTPENTGDLSVTDPDLTVGCPGKSSCPVTDGGAVPVSLTVHNNGTEDATNVDVGYFIGNPSSGGIMVGNTFVPTVKAGGSAPAPTFNWNTSDFAGDNTLYAVVDPDQAQGEQNYGDKTASIPITVLTKPDLSVQSVSFNPAEPIVGDPVTATVTVANSGQTASGSSSTQLVVSGSGDSGSIPITTPAVPAEASSTPGITTVQATIPAGDLAHFGPHTITATVNNTNSVNESNTTNDQSQSSLYVGLPATYIDSGGPSDKAYSAAAGYGYLNGSTQSFGSTPQETVRYDGSGPVQYQFDGLQPGRSYHLDASFYETQGNFTESVQFTNHNGNTTADSGKTISLVSGQLTTASILVPSAAYSGGSPSGSMTVSFSRTTSGPAFVSELELRPVEYRYIDAGPAETAYSAATGQGYLGTNTYAGTLSTSASTAINTYRSSFGSELDYQFDNLSPAKNYMVDVVMYDPSLPKQHQTVTVDGTPAANCIDLPIGSGPTEVSCPVPLSTYQTDNSIKVGILCVSCTGPILNTIALEQATTIITNLVTVTAGSPTTIYGHPVPVIQPIYTGFNGTDTAANSLTGKPVCTTAGTSRSPAGYYTTSCKIGTLASTKYLLQLQGGTLTVNLAQPALTYQGSKTLSNGKSAAMKATLLSDLKKPVVGRSVTFTLAHGLTKNSCTAKATSSTGVATCTISKVTAAKGSATLTVTFAGDKPGTSYDYAPATTAAIKVTVR